MTTDDTSENLELDKMNANLARVEALSTRLIAAMAAKKPDDPAISGPNPDLYLKAMGAYWADAMANPAKMIEQQVGFWSETMRHFAAAQQEMANGSMVAPDDPHPTDRRFANPLWQTNPYFNFVKQQYQSSAAAIQKAVRDVEGLDNDEKSRIEYFSQQIIDMMSPTNFLGTNPDALTRAIETEGQSLVDGLENLVRDIEDNDGDLLVRLADKDAFSVGENIAVSKGSVVFRNRMFELIQYAPTTDKVHKTPLILFPPWINKFYILDLKPQNSLIKWIVDQGFTLFVVSWVNPDADYRDVGLDTYIDEGYLPAIETVKAITGEKQVNAIGYCIAGAMFAVTLAVLKKRGDKSVKSATFFTTLTDFKDQGEISVFLSDDFIGGLEAEVEQKGYLHSKFMSKTFSYLRSNDLIYGPAIRNYMMGQSPPAFDLLFWNGDSTNLPGRMTREYLRLLCKDNRFYQDGLNICGETVSVKDVEVPVCSIACETDHIVAWRASYNGWCEFGSASKMFILSESGHIAGIVNPPSKKKYGHYTNDVGVKSADEWQQGAEFHAGSWWPRWAKWLAKQSGKKVEARAVGSADFPEICPAPGTYVVAKPKT